MIYKSNKYDKLMKVFCNEKKAKTDMTNFDRFITDCLKELKETRKTICFNIEQVNEIKKMYNNLKITFIDYYWLLII